MLRVPCCIAALPSQRAAAEPAAAAAAANGLAAAAREVPCVVGSVPTLVQRGAIPGPLQLEKIVRGLLRMRWWQHGLAALRRRSEVPVHAAGGRYRGGAAGWRRGCDHITLLTRRMIR